MAGPWKAGNIGVYWQPQLKRADKSIINITAMSPIKLQVENIDTLATAEVTGTIVDGALGKVKFLLDTLIVTAGTYDCEIQLEGASYKEDGLTFRWDVDAQVKT